MNSWEYWTWEQPGKYRISTILDIIIIIIITIIINLLELQTYYLLSKGNWIAGHKCPRGRLSTFFQGDLGYALSEAKERCSSACIASPECYYADLYYTSNKQTCYLKGTGCGDWNANTNSAYHLFVKGIDLISFLEHLSYDIILQVKDYFQEWQ